MGEYADDYFRNDVKRRFGFDPCSMYTYRSTEPKKRKKVNCKVCGKSVVGLADHQRDAHGIGVNENGN